MNLRPGAAGIVILLAACAGMPPDSATSTGAPVAQAGDPASPQDEKVCTWEQITGTHMTREICRSREEVEAERMATQRELDRIGRVPGTKSGN